MRARRTFQTCGRGCSLFTTGSGQRSGFGHSAGIAILRPRRRLTVLSSSGLANSPIRRRRVVRGRGKISGWEPPGHSVPKKWSAAGSARGVCSGPGFSQTSAPAAIMPMSAIIPRSSGAERIGSVAPFTAQPGTISLSVATARPAMFSAIQCPEARRCARPLAEHRSLRRCAQPSPAGACPAG